MNRLTQKYLPCKLSSLLLLLLCIFAVLMAGCVSSPAKYDSMIPTAFETTGKHSKTVSVSVQGGRETTLTTASQISDEAFMQALVDSIIKFQIFSNVVKGKGADYMLTVSLFDLKQPLFGLTYTVKMEAGWTLQRADNGTIVLQESIKSEHTATLSDAFAAVTRLRLATEGAAKDNIAKGLVKMSQLKL